MLGIRKFSAVVVLLSACVTPRSDVGDTVVEAAETNTYVLEDGTKVVCDYEADTGSHVRQRVCNKVVGVKPVEIQQAAHQRLQFTDPMPPSEKGLRK